MNILLVNPEYPHTFWSFTYALKFVSKRASHPPLGLLTVAALLPKDWNVRLVDMNSRTLGEKDLLWADHVYIGGMSAQAESARSVIARCNELGRTVVAGGPMFTSAHDEFEGVDHFVLNEAEITLPQFLADLAKGAPARMYTTTDFADVTHTPLPRWSLLDRRRYASMSLQYSRGCPYDCEFCDITVLYGRRPRTKRPEQITRELDGIFATGWRGHVFVVDDNFIGNRRALKTELLPAMASWMEEHGHPFTFGTEASINLADDPELLRMMVSAGFNVVFVGIESPSDESLQECHKTHNRNRDLLESIRTIQQAGLEVQGGFIVGFDKDPENIFEQMVRFIQESGIATAMVGLLNAPRGTKLYKRLQSEGRLLETFTGVNTDGSLNFIPAMDREKLLEGYRSILRSIYTPKEYYARVKKFLSEFSPPRSRSRYVRLPQMRALMKSIVLLGVIGRERVYYWKIFFWSMFTRPRLFPHAITLMIYGFHFRKVFEHQIL